MKFDPRQAAHALIRDAPPPKPACFPSLADWKTYLLQAHESGARVVRRTDTGKHAGHRTTGHAFVEPTVSHCEDCTSAYRLRMRAAGRCHPTIPIKETIMKFRSPTDAPVHLALTSGHTAVVGPDPVELDARWHRVAIARGCAPVSGLTALSPELRMLAADRDDAAAAERDRAERAAQVHTQVEKAEREHRERTGKDLPWARREQIRREAAQQLERATTA